MVEVYQPAPVETIWTYGLFECFDSLSDCLFSYCCPPCYAAYAANYADEPWYSSLIQCLCYPYGLLYLRPMIRNQLNIEGSIFKDILVTCCCPFCAYIQIKREFESYYV